MSAREASSADVPEDRRLELINAEIDGRLSPSERAELEALLAADPATLELRDDLRTVAEQLADLPELEPPGALRRAIRGAMSSAAAPPEGEVSLASRLRHWLGAPATLRLAGVFAAGLAVGAFVLAPDQGLGLRGLSGTMAAYEAGADDAVDRLTMDEAGITGSVGIHDRGSLYVIEYDLTAEEPVEVVTAYKGSDASFNGFAHIGDGDTRAVAEGQRVWLSVDGHRRYAIFLSRPESQAGEVEIDVYAGDRLLHRGNLRVPAVARAP
jgi:hypothetical protein